MLNAHCTDRGRCVTGECLDSIHSYPLRPGDIRCRYSSSELVPFRKDRVHLVSSSYHPLNHSEMSPKTCQSAVTLAVTTLRRTGPFRITPPPVYVQERTYFTRRSTSFYTNSYPQSGQSGVEVPYTPPAPAADRPTSSSNNEYGVHEDGRRKERKAKYLESLMDKAGELSLRCMSIPLICWSWLTLKAQSLILMENGEPRRVGTRRQNYVVNTILMYVPPPVRS
jgi:hypothetical protein